MNDYIKQIEEQNEELKKLLAAAQTEVADLKEHRQTVMLLSNDASMTDRLCWMASVIIAKSGHHEYVVLKNRNGPTDKIISYEEATNLIVHGDVSCLK